MDEAISRVASAAGIDDMLAGRALAVILDVVAREAPAEPVARLFAALPGAAEHAASGAGAGRGVFQLGGLLGAGQRLMNIGLDMAQVEAVTRATVAYAREAAGEEIVGEVVAGIPGLSQFT